MQKSLKKSLYLGLAALSFASVAGATNANAAKKHNSKKTVKTVKKAKPVTYTSSYNLDQSVVYSLNGNNAIYTKPGTVKGARVVASKSDVKSVANSSKGYFMAYGEAKTSKGVHYYKVVSFDHKYRGWVYAGSAKKVDSTTTATDTPKNNVVYLKSNVSNTLWDAPKYSAFKTTKAANNNSGIANDQYVVDKAVKLNREGWTYYHVTNKTNANYSGWVWAGATNAAAPTENFNAAKDIKVNFVYNGSSVKSSVFHAYDMGLMMYNGQPYNKTDLNNKLFNRTDLAKFTHNQNGSLGWLATQLQGTGYTLAGLKDNKNLFANNADNTLSFADNTNNQAKLSNVKAGDTVWLDIIKDNQHSASKFTPMQITAGGYNTNGATPITNYVKPYLNKDIANYFLAQDPDKLQYNVMNGSPLYSKLTDVEGVVNAVEKANYTNLSFLTNDKNNTYLDASNSMTVYKSDKDAAEAYKAALGGFVLDNTNANPVVADGNAVSINDNFTIDNKAVSTKPDYKTFNKVKDNNGSYVLIMNSNGRVVASADATSTASNLVNVKAVKSSVQGKLPFGRYLTSINEGQSKQGKYVSSATLLEDFAGLNRTNNADGSAFTKEAPYGVFDAHSKQGLIDNTTKKSSTSYTTVANGGDPIHYVYFLAQQQTEDGMKHTNMGQNVNFYYYAVPVAGSAKDYNSNGVNNY